MDLKKIEPGMLVTVQRDTDSTYKVTDTFVRLEERLYGYSLETRHDIFSMNDYSVVDATWPAPQERDMGWLTVDGERHYGFVSGRGSRDAVDSMFWFLKEDGLCGVHINLITRSGEKNYDLWEFDRKMPS